MQQHRRVGADDVAAQDLAGRIDQELAEAVLLLDRTALGRAGVRHRRALVIGPVRAQRLLRLADARDFG